MYLAKSQAKQPKLHSAHLHVLKVLVLDAVHVDSDAVWLCVVELEDVNTCHVSSQTSSKHQKVKSVRERVAISRLVPELQHVLLLSKHNLPHLAQKTCWQDVA